MKLPNGFLGTRADILMDFVVVGIIITPLLMFYAFRLANGGRYIAHRNLNMILVSVLLLVVVLFEIDIRLAGGSKAFIGGSHFADAPFLTWLLRVHITIAVTSFLGWVLLEIKSFKSFLKILPGEFSSNHKKFGIAIFCGVILTAITGVSVYILSFAI